MRKNWKVTYETIILRSYTLFIRYSRYGRVMIIKSKRQISDFDKSFLSTVLQRFWVLQIKLSILVRRTQHQEIAYRVKRLTSSKVSKCVVRGLTNTLRMEAFRLSDSISTYTIHCAFLSNFISSAFLEKQKRKPELIISIEDTTGSMTEWEKRFPSAEKVAQETIVNMMRDDFALCDDSMKSRLHFANMIDSSSKSEFDIRDSLLTTAIGQLIWLICRRCWDKMCKKDKIRLRSKLVS